MTDTYCEMDTDSLELLNLSENRDVTINWEEFDFGKEMEALDKSFELYTDELQLLDNDTLDILNKKSRFSELEQDVINFLDVKTKHDNIIHQGKDWTEKWKILDNEVDDLKIKESNLEQKLKESEEEEAKMKEECKMLNTAYNKAIEKYTKNFDLKITSENVSKSKYQALIRFKSKVHMKPIRLLVDRSERKILAFDASEIFKKEEHENFMKKYGDLKNIPQMLCSVRDYIFANAK